MINQWAEKFVEDPNSSVNNVFGSLFQYYKDHADFYKLLVDNDLSECKLTVIKERVGMSSDFPNKLAYKKAFFAYGLYGWILEWLDKGMQEGADEIQAMLSLRWHFICYPALGVLFALRTTLQALGQKMIPITSSGVELWGKIIFGFLVIPAVGYIAVCIAEPIIS